MTESLSPRQFPSQDRFFHGTTHAIKDGMVRPANATDKNVSEYSMGDPGDMSEGDHAFTIRNNEGYAWHAANTFHPSLRRSRVYETGPAEDMKPGPWNKEHPDFLYHHELDDPDDYPTVGPDSDDYRVQESMREAAEEARANHQDEWASKTGFPIKQRHDIMPGRQGTFPGISWGRFSERPYDQTINHPTSEQVRYGTRGAEAAHSAALKENTAIDDARRPRRTGRSLRAFMEGKPDPGPLADHPKLF